jgi:GT2 family glycosyltransferase
MMGVMNKKHSSDISVIIPFKDRAKMTLEAVVSLQEFGPAVKEILLVSNNSNNKELAIIKQAVVGNDTVKVLEYNHPFNYQKINNWAARQATGSVLFFLNNDTEFRPSSVGLLERMSEEALKPSVGMAGCLLLYGDGATIQHAGVFLLPRGQADHLYAGRRLSQATGANRNKETFPYDITRDLPMTAVTGAAQVVEAKKFWEIGGFDERFIICGGDVDLCIRLNNAGYQTQFVSGGYIIHKESQSRAFKPIPYNDFYWSYLSYMKGFDYEKGDKFLPLITNKKVYR